jgi:hypothetical protein
MAKKWRIPGLSFSWKRAIGLTSLRQKIARATGIPTTAGGRRRKFGPFGLFWLLGGGSGGDASGAGCVGAIVLLLVGGATLTVCGCAGMIGLGMLTGPSLPNPPMKVASAPSAPVNNPVSVPTAIPESSAPPVETVTPTAEPATNASTSTTPAPEVTPPKPAEKTFDPQAISFSAEETTDRTRTFNSTDGKFSVEAVLLAMRDEVAHLKRVDNGNVIEVPMAKLANSDRIWIRKIVAADKIRNRY